MSTAIAIPEVTESTEAVIIEKAQSLIEQAGRVPALLPDPETCGRAGDLAKFLKVAGTKLDELRDSRVRPLNQQVKDINASFKPMAEAIESARRGVLSKVTAFQLAEDKRRREEAEAARRKQEEEALAAATKAEAEGKKEEAEAIVEKAATAVVPTATTSIARGDFGSTTSLRDNWTFEVEDFAALPDAYKLTNEQALRALAKNGRPTLPGVRWINNRTAVAR